ncbi:MULTISPECIES: alpha/beta fold hydrolase [Pseudoalteromonas]|uniref:alpha/beta hydrolase n=1 Tax=Pseudoalteromonas TaxID=53246 RepID=UPI000231A3AD|nr:MULTISPECIES: alpha/beta fold hydrolase [Pseudoalteromonas]GAA74923.1 hypothetical protein P20480_1388 [Pseudoalteromonas sp. BSi20480]
MKHSLHLIILILLILSQTACKTINISESHFIKPNKNITLSTLSAINNSVQITPIEISAHDGNTLRGTYLSIANPKATVVYFGGNEFTIQRNSAGPATILIEQQVNILMLDYRGYGQSSGIPNIKNMKQDALDIYDFAKQQSNIPIVLHGHSLGSMIAGYIATQRPVDGLVLEGSITNVKQMTSARIPWYAKPFININFSKQLTTINNLKMVQDYKSPLLIMTGENDMQTPISLAKELYKEAISSQKQLYIAKGMHHGNALKGAELKSKYAVLLSQITKNNVPQ